MDFQNSFDCFVFDLDGVIYSGNKTLGNSPKILQSLRKNKKIIRFLTNNPSRSPSEYVERLSGLGIESNENEYITSPMATVSLIREKLPYEKWKTVFVAGSDYLRSEVRKTGLAELRKRDSLKVDLVVVGSHGRFNLEEIKHASIAVGNGAGFIGTNADSFYLCEYGRAPATGALLASIEAASGKRAVTAGKPEKYMFDLLEKSETGAKNRTIIIGDSLGMDIAGGKKAGYSAALVMTGVTEKNDLKNAEIKPDFILPDLSALLKK